MIQFSEQRVLDKVPEERSKRTDCFNIVNWIKRELSEYKLPKPYLKGGQVHLQFHGWALILLDNGTWFIQDTSGG